MAFDFPSPATVNQIITMPDGTQRMFDGTKWRSAGLAPGPYLPLSGGSLTGPLALAADPTSAMQAATKEYVDATAPNNTGRNLVHNGQMNVWQRGTGSWTVAGNYTADRWRLYFGLDTASVSQQTFAVGNPVDESAFFCLTNVFTGNAGATAYTLVYQPIEDVRRLSNRTVTVSFYASASSGTPRLGVSLDQSFGTGGSPSAAVQGNGQAVTLSTTWIRYSLTFSLPSLAGKVLGTNGDHFTELNFWYSSGTNNAARAGSIGVQSGTIALWGVQLEVGSVATPLAKRDPADDLALCQRFYQIVSTSLRGQATGVTNYGYGLNWLVQMRVAPTIGAVSGANNSNVNSAALGSATAFGGYFNVVPSAAGDFYSLGGNYPLSADL